MKEYFKRLKTHPGVPMAFGFTLLGFMARATNKTFPHWWIGGLFGAAFLAIIFWPIVLLSNIKRNGK
jgi:hypothetical protein